MTRPVRVGRTGAAAVVLAVVVAALVALLVLQFAAWADRGASATAGREATDAAATGIERLLTYDSADMPAAVAEIGELTGGDFREEFTRLFDTVVAPAALEQQAASTATVVARSLVSATPDEVVSLLFVNQTTTSSTLPGDRIDTIEARVTMQRVDGAWLVSELEQV